MEYVSRIMIFGVKMIVKSGLKKFILKFLYAKHYFTELSLLYKREEFCPKVQIPKIKMTLFANGGISKKIFVVDVLMVNEL